MFFLRKKSQFEWLSDYLERMTYLDAEDAWKKWENLGGEIAQAQAPKKPSIEEIIKIMLELEKFGFAVRDIHRPERYAWLAMRRLQAWSSSS